MRISENRLRSIIRRVIVESYDSLSPRGYYRENEMRVGGEVVILDVPPGHIGQTSQDLVGETGRIIEMDPMSQSCVVELTYSGRSISLPCHERYIDHAFRA